jgi:PPOX class probable F420-dependent enzyme
MPGTMPEAMPGTMPGTMPEAMPGTIPPVPESHRDLLTGAVHGILATMMPDGQPQASVVWVDYNGTDVLINTTLERRKSQNMRVNPRVSLLVIDPRDGSRWIEVRGRVAEMRREGAEAHADMLTQRYTRKERFYGDIYPVEQRQRETRVIVVIEPLKLSMDAIFR